MWAVRGEGQAGLRFTVIPMGSDEGPLDLEGVLGTGRLKDRPSLDGGFFVLELNGYMEGVENLDTSSELGRRN